MKTLMGLCIGSFLSLIADRIPKKQSIIFPLSNCDYCHENIAWYDLIPIVSFINLKGRCRYCKSRISIDKPLIEVLSALILNHHLKAYVTLSTCLSASLSLTLMLISAIDFKTKTIPLRFHLFFLVFTYLTHSTYSVTFDTRLLGAFLIPSIFLALTILTNGIGGGDGLLMMSSGFLLGFFGSFLTLTIATVSALIYALFQKSDAHIPFAPFICLGIYCAYHHQFELMHLYYVYFI